MFQRKIIHRLEEWRRDPGRKPLILRGARQVGKTTVVNEFGKQFDNYLYFNMEDASHARLFELEVPLLDLIPLLFSAQGVMR